MRWPWATRRVTELQLAQLWESLRLETDATTAALLEIRDRVGWLEGSGMGVWSEAPDGSWSYEKDAPPPPPEVPASVPVALVDEPQVARLRPRSDVESPR